MKWMMEWDMGIDCSASKHIYYRLNEMLQKTIENKIKNIKMEKKKKKKEITILRMTCMNLAFAKPCEGIWVDDMIIEKCLRSETSLASVGCTSCWVKLSTKFCLKFPQSYQAQNWLSYHTYKISMFKRLVISEPQNLLDFRVSDHCL